MAISTYSLGINSRIEAILKNQFRQVSRALTAFAARIALKL